MLRYQEEWKRSRISKWEIISFPVVKTKILLGVISIFTSLEKFQSVIKMWTEDIKESTDNENILQIPYKTVLQLSCVVVTALCSVAWFCKGFWRASHSVFVTPKERSSKPGRFALDYCSQFIKHIIIPKNDAFRAEFWHLPGLPWRCFLLSLLQNGFRGE